MADIQVQCESCGKAVVVSQYADLGKIICRQCGEPIKSAAAPPPAKPAKAAPKPAVAAEPAAKPAAKPAAHKPVKLGLRRKQEAPPPATEPVADAPARDPKKNPGALNRAPVIADVRELNANRPQKRFRMTVEMWALLLFIALGSLMGFLRFGSILPYEYLSMMIEFSGIVLLVMHLIVAVSAFKDSVFDGTLCLLVPGYSLYYALFCTEDMFVRAVFASILVGFGYDGSLWMADQAQAVFVDVKAWIDSGGGSW